MIFAWQPGEQYHAPATLCTNTVLASGCRALFGLAASRSGMSHLCDTTVAGQAVRRDKVLATNLRSRREKSKVAKEQKEEQWRSKDAFGAWSAFSHITRLNAAMHRQKAVSEMEQGTL